MILEVLESGSKANCYILRGEEEVRGSYPFLILECGVRWGRVLEAVGYDTSGLSGCLLTHEHGDHGRFAEEYLSKRVPIYASRGTVEALSLFDRRFVCPIEKNRKYELKNGFTVIPFEACHDAREPLGYYIRHEEMGTLLFVTDTYIVKPRFKGLNHVMIECNYSEEILNKRAAEDERVALRLKRLRESHLSLETVKKTLERNDLKEVQEIVLIHLSREHSDARYFRGDIEWETGIPTYVAERGVRIRLNRNEC